jgi:hypothetical protein
MVGRRQAIVGLLIWSLGAVPLVQDACAWSARGHRLTALIAYEMLTPSSKARLKTILGTSDLATAALYLDLRKTQLEQAIKGSRDWHFDNRPVCNASAAKTEYCPGGNCASVRIRQHFDVLEDPGRTKAERLFAVRVISHLVGDIHQPLHASNHGDVGGNKVKLAGSWQAGPKASLHTVWDDDFVDMAFAGTDYRNKSELQIAKRLAAQITDAQKQAWVNGGVDRWLQESYKLATQTAYGGLAGFACSDGEQEQERIELSGEYVGKAIAVVPEQLKKAGVRLAGILNRLLSGAKPGPGDVWVWNP